MKVTWLFRKPQPEGHFSIENSFRTLREHWEAAEQPMSHEVGHHSSGLWNRLAIVFEVRWLKTDVVHITGDIYFAAFAFLFKRKNRPKLIATIHDIGYLIHSHPIKKRIIKWIWFSGPLKQLDHLITVSEQTKLEVMREAPWFSPKKISVIPTVIPQHFNPRNGPPKNDRPIALHIGVADNKNLRRHAQALDGLGVHLRIIGQPNTEDQGFLSQLDLKYNWQSQLSDEEMQQAYASSDFLLFCSTLEGFGMPILEAQMVGLPVITSNIEPMKGVAGEGAMLCNPLEVGSIRTAVKQMLDFDKLRMELVQKGVDNARRFHPNMAVQAHLELYRDITSK